MMLTQAAALSLAWGLFAAPSNLPPHAIPIDRHTLVSRHNITLTQTDPLTPLSVGNGEFALTVDRPGQHTTLARIDTNSCRFERVLDADRYYVGATWSGAAVLTETADC